MIEDCKIMHGVEKQTGRSPFHSGTSAPSLVEHRLNQASGSNLISSYFLV